MQISQEIVNPKEKIGPEDFELLKVLGKGGYGKVLMSNVIFNDLCICSELQNTT